MYKQASKLKLRFSTPQGVLTVEQLWDLRLSQLALVIKAVKKLLNKNNEDQDLDFLDDTKSIDKESELRFDILKDIYLTKKEEEERRRKELEDKKYNDNIDTLIAYKKEEELSNKTIEELEKLKR